MGFESLQEAILWTENLNKGVKLDSLRLKLLLSGPRAVLPNGLLILHSPWEMNIRTLAQECCHEEKMAA